MGGSFAFAAPPIEQGRPTLINQPGGGSVSSEDLVTQQMLQQFAEEVQAYVNQTRSEMEQQSNDRFARQSNVVQLLERLSALEREVQTLRGENEVLAERLRRAETDSRDRYIELDRRLSGGSSERDSGEPAPPQASDMAVGSTEASEDEQRVYRRARDLIAEREYDRAIQAFGDFLAEYPSSPLASDAWYWKAEVHTLLRQYEEADEAYRRVVDDFPDADKQLDAIFKRGFVAERVGNTSEARAFYQEVVDSAPDSSLGGMASRRLEAL